MRPHPLALALALAVATAGCETFTPSTCDRSEEDNPPFRYTGGVAKDGVYTSSGKVEDGGQTTLEWNGELLYFPGGRRYDLVHGLDRAPRWVNSYLSFDRYGTADGGVLAPAAGNQVEILGVDDEVIHLTNDSCVEYWLLVVAGSGAQP